MFVRDRACRRRWLAGALVAIGLGGGLSPRPSTAQGLVLVECEGFADYGGWSIDQQFMDVMGSPYLLAHGLGTPVADAVTTVEFRQPGQYRLWVRTKDWVAPWKAPGTPGRFQLRIDGRAVPTTFGTEGAAWHWQDGGTVDIHAPKVKLALHDLTGFEGRCDAVLFCADQRFVPPNKAPELTSFRRQTLGISATPEDGGNYDLVVVGGGMAGTAAALKAARLGCRVALVHDRPVLGGNNSSEVRVSQGGGLQLAPYPHVGDIVKEIEPVGFVAGTNPEHQPQVFDDQRKMAPVRRARNIRLLLGHRVNAVAADGGILQAVVAQDIRSGRSVRLTGRLFADCTGDGTVGALAGADSDMTRVDHMGPTNHWGVKDTGRPTSFPRCPWALDLAHKPFPGRAVNGRPPRGNPLNALGTWFWESGSQWHPIAELELMRDYNLRAMYGAWDALKNVDGVFPTHRLEWAAYVAGKRESRRLLGDVVLTVDDFTTDRQFSDGCVPCTWGVDLHYPDPAYVKGLEGGLAFISKATAGDRPGGKWSYKVPFWMPYRALYSRNINNLFMAGRDVSVTHEALGPVRVQRTTGMMGEIVGMAAAVCTHYDCRPRAVYQQHLDALKRLMRGEALKTNR
jgi:hypothetical protein